MILNNDKVYKDMLENMYEGIYFVDTERKITFWNKGAERITGYLAKEVVGSHCYNNILNHINNDGVELCKTGCPLHKTIEDGIMREAAVYLHHKGGHRVPVSVRTIAINNEGKNIGAVEVFTDDSERHDIIKNIEELKKLAMRDQLTGLPNRRYIDTFIESKMNEFSSLKIPFGIAFMDIDKFKNFNDTYGHDTGDEVLKLVAKTFNAVVRSTDLVGRWGGEEFVAVFSGVDMVSIRKLTEKIRMLVERSTIYRCNEVLKVTISIGATIINETDIIEDIIKRADTLLYQSKSNGRNRVTIG